MELLFFFFSIFISFLDLFVKCFLLYIYRLLMYFSTSVVTNSLLTFSFRTLCDVWVGLPLLIFLDIKIHNRPYTPLLESMKRHYQPPVSSHKETWITSVTLSLLLLPRSSPYRLGSWDELYGSTKTSVVLLVMCLFFTDPHTVVSTPPMSLL